MATSKINLIDNMRFKQQTLSNGITIRLAENNEMYIIQADGTPTNTDDMNSFALSDVAWDGPNYIAPLINYGGTEVRGKIYYNGGYVKAKANSTAVYVCGVLVIPKG